MSGIADFKKPAQLQGAAQFAFGAAAQDQNVHGSSLNDPILRTIQSPFQIISMKGERGIPDRTDLTDQSDRTDHLLLALVS
jgi:hypothetical protein